MHKQSTKGRKYSKEILSDFFFLLRQADMLFTRFSQQVWNFFFCSNFPKKWVGRAMGNETFYSDGLTRFQTKTELLGSI